MIAYINASFDLSIVLASFCYPKFQIIISRTFKTERHILIRPLFLFNSFITNTLLISKTTFLYSHSSFFHFFLLLKIYGYQKLLKDMLLVLMYDMTLYERIKVVTELFFFSSFNCFVLGSKQHFYDHVSFFMHARPYSYAYGIFGWTKECVIHISIPMCSHPFVV